MNDSVEKFITTPRNLAGKSTNKNNLLFTNAFYNTVYVCIRTVVPMLEISVPGAYDTVIMPGASFCYSY